MTKVLIAIPSKKRAEILEKNALTWVQHVGVEWRVFIEKEDLEAYQPLLPNGNLYVLPESNQGLGYSKTQIRYYAETHGYDFVLKLDDDVKGWTEYRTHHLGEKAGKYFKSVLDKCLKLLEEKPEVAVVAFPYSFQMFEPVLFKKQKRVQTAYLARTAYFHADTRISVFEDFAVGLNAIYAGKLVVAYGLAGIEMGVQVGKGEGGHQSFNRHDRVQYEMPILSELFPGVRFREVNKPWKYEPDLKSVKGAYYMR